mmetsp:Transcript_32428/g.49614  ORF Transcript_32428/g.49614 Transcript_32428/m.49614 type:complete len:105 (-) Transcript_32428:1855-2169(-)
MGHSFNQSMDNSFSAGGSVQAQRKRRSIMHDNLTNTRTGGSRIQHNNHNSINYEYDISANIQSIGPHKPQGIGMQSPPSLPNQGMMRQTGGFQKINEGGSMMSY